MTIYYAIRAAAILRGMWWWWGIPILALIIFQRALFLMTIGLDEIANPRCEEEGKGGSMTVQLDAITAQQ
jgi:peptide/nickel transport system permease protein